MGMSNICVKCGAENSADARFCQLCGSALEKVTGKKFCTQCGTENDREARFCLKCGHTLAPNEQHRRKAGSKKRSHQAKKKEAPPPPGSTTEMKVLKVGAVFFVLFIIYMLLPEKKQPDLRQPVSNIQPPVLAEQKSNDPRLEAEVLDIAAKFICSCGTCGEQPLQTCTCDVAIAERQFIRKELQAKNDPESIIRLVNEKYGWIKPQYTEKYGAGKSRPRLEKRLPDTPGLSILDDKTDVAPATPSDRLAIISSFACTCGQCGIDELKDCNCNHPGGAREVKAFIDQKISEGKYSKENIVEIVDARYGNRIR